MFPSVEDLYNLTLFLYKKSIIYFLKSLSRITSLNKLILLFLLKLSYKEREVSYKSFLLACIKFYRRSIKYVIVPDNEKVL